MAAAWLHYDFTSLWRLERFLPSWTLAFLLTLQTWGVWWQALNLDAHSCTLTFSVPRLTLQ